VWNELNVKPTILVVPEPPQEPIEEPPTRNLLPGESVRLSFNLWKDQVLFFFFIYSPSDYPESVDCPSNQGIVCASTISKFSDYRRRAHNK
jgi:hypothetical protein